MLKKLSIFFISGIFEIFIGKILNRGLYFGIFTVVFIGFSKSKFPIVKTLFLLYSKSVSKYFWIVCFYWCKGSVV